MVATEAGFVTKTMALTAKDLRIELRARDTLPPMLAFVVAVTLLLGFTLPGIQGVRRPVQLPFGTVPAGDVIAGFFWVVVLFAGLIGFARTFEIERHDGALDSLLLVPLDRSGLFFAKALANGAFLGLVQLFLIPLFALLFGLDLGRGWGLFVVVAVLADIGFVSVGTLFSALAAQTRSRELMLPVLALPILLPLFIAASELSADLIAGEGVATVATRGWFAVLVAFDLVFVTVGSLSFDFAME